MKNQVVKNIREPVFVYISDVFINSIPAQRDELFGYLTFDETVKSLKLKVLNLVTYCF